MADPEKTDINLKKAMLTVSDGVLGAAVLIVIGMWGGSFLDGKLHTSPWLSIALSIIGGMGGLARLVVKVIKLES
jgi:F0F1-type ATP synthase assembly protein I